MDEIQAADGGRFDKSVPPRNPDLVGALIEERCPYCGSSLLGNKVGDKWCSFIGCTYGLNVPPKGIRLIMEERRRQVQIEGWSIEHDDQSHDFIDLQNAAECYHMAQDDSAIRSSNWPWSNHWWKPKSRLRNLVRAGALYQASIDWLQRRIAAITEQRDAVAEEIDKILKDKSDA